MSIQNNIPNNKLPLKSFELTVNDDPEMNTLSLSLFVVGCIRRCKNCQNPDIQELTENNHILLDLDQVKKVIDEKSILVKSVVFCGGDFLPNYKFQLKELVNYCKSKNLKTILYTGELYENINEELKNKINIIVDGPYDDDKRTNRFPASSNQRCFINGEIVDCDELKINKMMK